MNADLDVLLDTALELGLPDHVVVSLARVVNLMWLQERRSVTLPTANLMAYLGIESRNTLDAHLRAYVRVPGLTVKKASGYVFIHYCPPRDERAMDAQPARNSDGASDTISVVAQSLPNERAVDAQSSHGEGRGAQSARNERAMGAQSARSGGGGAQSLPNGRAMDAQSARNGRAIGGGYRGGLACLLAVTEPETELINLFGLNSKQAGTRAEGGGGVGEGETVPVAAQSARGERAMAAQWLLNGRAIVAMEGSTAAQLARNGRAMAAQSQPNERAVRAQSTRNERATDAHSVDRGEVDAFLGALARLGKGRPVFGGREMSRADARAVLEVAARQGHSLDLVLAEAMALEEEFRRKGKDMGSPVALLRHWVARPDLAEHVPRSLHREARKILGLEPEEAQEGGESRPGEDIEVEIVGHPPYDPAQVWEKALERLRDGLGRVDFNTWLRDSRLVRWEDGLFVIGVPNVLAKDWLRNRLDGRVREALQAVTGNEDVGVMYAVVPRISKAAMAKTTNRRYTGGSYGH